MMHPSLLVYILSAVLVADCQTDISAGKLFELPRLRLITSLSSSNAAESTNSINESGHQSIQVHEYYSNQQQRARLELHPVGGGDQVGRIDYFYENLPNTKRLASSYESEFGMKCDSYCDTNHLADSLFGNLSKIYQQFSGVSWQDLGAPDLPGHIIGPSRIFFFINQRRHLLSQFGDKQADIFVRNKQVVRYDFISSDLEDPEVTVYYGDTDEDENSLPLRISMKSKAGIVLRIDLLQAHEIDQDNLFSYQKELDLFSFPVGIGCSSNFSTSATSLEWYINPPEIKVASFKAKFTEIDELLQSRPVQYERFVAYDKAAMAMRVDTIKSNQYAIDIYDFKTDRIYNIMHETNGKLSDDRLAAGSEQQCIAATSIFLTKFIDFRYMNQMGRAVVRGLDCSVFEEVTTELPAILFPYVNYRNKKGTFFRRTYEQVNSPGLEDHSEPYSIVYYFVVAQSFGPEPRLAHRDVALGPLIQIDVYKRGVLRYSLSITNYVYRLMDAPNGDEQVDLFALRNRCAARKTQDGQAAILASNYADVEFELTYKPMPVDSVKEVAELLSSSSIRNKAIVRAIASGNFVVSATQIYDVESSLELRNNDTSLMIYGSCRFEHMDVESVALKVIGFTSSEFEKFHHAPIEDCFWEAARRRSSVPGGKVLLVGCKSRCIIEDEPKVMPNETYGSDLFEICDDHDSCPCAVVLMEEEVKKSDGLFKIWDEAYRMLKGNSVELTLADSDTPKPDEKLEFTIDHLEISNDRWSSSLGYESATLDGKHSSLKNGQLINGVGLTPANGQLEFSRKSSRNSASGMSFTTCHSLCMTNMKCSSFSVCINAHAMECVTSQENIGDPLLLNQIELKRKEPISADEKTRLIQISLDKNRTIELKLDVRCRLYKKDALEIFQKVPATVKDLGDAYTVSVGGPDECADLCLKSNMVFFNKMSDLRQRLIANESIANSTDRMADEYTNYLSSWCHSFRYLDLLFNSVSLERLAEFVDPVDLNQAGLCSLMIPARMTHKKDSQETNSELELELHEYRFVYANLYEAQYGLMMNTDRAGDQSLRLNTFRLTVPDSESCARACFLQLNGLRPWCKSFDYIVDRVQDPSDEPLEPQIKSYCVLNSLSSSDLADHLDEYLVETVNLTSWHYEPREPFMMESLAGARNLLFPTIDSSESIELEPELEPGAWIIALMVLFALVCSTWLVVGRGNAMLDHLQRHRLAGYYFSLSDRTIRSQPTDQIDLNELQTGENTS